MENKPQEKKEKKSFFQNLKDFPSKKPYIEFFTALLTVPVLLTVIFLNVDNIRGKADTKATDSKDDSKQTIVITQPPGESVREKEVIVTEEACEPGIGEFSISSPTEGENVTDNPLFIDIDYDSNGYCNIIWSYRINGGPWSSYDDRSISLYNLENGEVTLDLRVKSVVNSDQESITRTFIYSGTSNISPTEGVTPTPQQ